MNKVQMTISISADVHTQLKILSATQKKKMWEIVQQSIETYLANQQAKNK